MTSFLVFLQKVPITAVSIGILHSARYVLDRSGRASTDSKMQQVPTLG